jgi:CDP-diacylglycerol pyrophosphatase
MRFAPAVLLALLLALGGAPGGVKAADPSALWKIVNGECVPHEQKERNPAPCAEVDLAQGVAKGFVVLKDIRGIAQFLLIPTARIGGIEDPAILAPDATNYWDAAWKARTFVEDRLHTQLPRDAVSLAINSEVGRTQDQLHIHIDCIRPDVREALAANRDKIEAAWTPFPVPLAGRAYRAIRIDHATLDGIDAFRILADGDPQARGDMGMHTLVLVGETFAGDTLGFVLLDDHANLAAGNYASGEQLQDHTCAIAQQ